MTANLSQRRSHARHGAREIEATITAALDEIEAQKAAERAELKAARAAAEASRHRFTRDELTELAPRVVRDGYGWRRVIRINASTVTVPGTWGDTTRIPFDRILEAKA